VSTDAERKRRWLADYLDALPDHLRTTPTDPLLLEAARVAYGNGWSPRRIATAVATRSYNGVMFPSRIAITRMSEIAVTAPRLPLRARRCGCDDVDCAIRPIPAEWVAERWVLVKKLMHTRDLTEDQRESHMVALIRKQEAER
jgi:hypothetical protein